MGSGDVQRTEHNLWVQSGADVRGGATLPHDGEETSAVFRATVFPLELTQSLLRDRHVGNCGDCLDLYVRISPELSLGSGDMGNVYRGRLGLGTMWAGADLHIGRNFDGRTIWGAELNVIDETRMMIPGIVIGFDRMPASKDEPEVNQLTLGLRWALPWLGTDWDHVGIIH